MKNKKEIISLVTENKDGSIQYLAGDVHPETHKFEERGPTKTFRGKKFRSYKVNHEPLKYEVYIDEDQQILKSNKTYELIIDYPVQTPMVSKIKGPKTLRQVVDFAVKQYRKMYKEEDKTSSKKASKIPRMWNRQSTNGKYGIYGHDLSDLSIDSVIIKDSKIYLSVSS